MYQEHFIANQCRSWFWSVVGKLPTESAENLYIVEPTLILPSLQPTASPIIDVYTLDITFYIDLLANGYQCKSPTISFECIPIDYASSTKFINDTEGDNAILIK